MAQLPFDYAVRNLGRSRTRLALAVMGSALVVTLIIASGAFVRGMSRSIRQTGSSANIILLGAGSEESIERSEVEPAAAGLVEASLAGIRAHSGVSLVSPEVHVQLPVGRGGDAAGAPAQSRRPVLIRGVTPAALLVHDQVQLVEGRLSGSASDEVVVGRMVGATLGIPERELAIGKQVLIDNRPWTIVGRFVAPGTVFDAEIWASLPQLMSATRRQTISCVTMTLDPKEAEFADVDAFTKTRPDLELSAVREVDYYAGLSAFFAPIRVVALITAGLIALGGLFGGLNTMYAAFASRGREVGTLRTLGYRRSAIVLSLVQESLLATSAGALVGAAVGLLLLDGVSVRFSLGAFGLVVDAPVVAIGLGAGLALGVVGALPPALRCLNHSIPSALKSN